MTLREDPTEKKYAVIKLNSLRSALLENLSQSQIITRSSTCDIMTTALSPAKAVLIFSTT
jgi:hypothetical protein